MVFLITTILVCKLWKINVKPCLQCHGNGNLVTARDILLPLCVIACMCILLFLQLSVIIYIS